MSSNADMSVVTQLVDVLRAYQKWAHDHIRVKPDAWRDNSGTIDERGMERLREIEELASRARTSAD